MKKFHQTETICTHGLQQKDDSLVKTFGKNLRELAENLSEKIFGRLVCFCTFAANLHGVYPYSTCFLYDIMQKKEFAFSRINFIMLAVAMAIVVVGMVLMAGDASTAEKFNPEVFNAMHIKVAPLVCLAGYLLMIVAVLYPGKRGNKEADTDKTK